jgi:protoheme IX farnesyltransferase
MRNKKQSNSTFSRYYRLTKPGIIKGNLFTAVAGYLLAAGFDFAWLNLIGTLAGVAFVIGSGCVFNNVIDRDIDKKMARTKKLELVQGTISVKVALAFATALGLAGFACLAIFANWLTVAIGLVGMLFYVVIYAIGKRASSLGTVIGSISGAIPPVAGYTAAAGHLDNAAFLLFLIMALWQMPHFYAIAMYRLKDYSAAGIPVLPAVKGMRTTKIYILLYVVAYTIAAVSLSFLDYTGLTYLIVMMVLGMLWFLKGIQGFKTKDDDKWARMMFGYSLVVMTTWSVLICANELLP